ncbi:hypothetical protein ACDY97_30105 [Rhizobium mongolense]|uniref:hypothetical protein n=1 Tax=Rhizobium mongolense TaxID=57676 RepID=UPI003557CF1C
MSTSYVSAGIAIAVAALVGFGAGYQVSNMTMSTKITELEQKVTNLEAKPAEIAQIDGPTDEQATAALQNSIFKGSEMKISECKEHQGFPGVMCVGTVTTVTGEFAGNSRVSTLPFAKIDGVWTYAN